jgi:hypothetical protein
VRSLGAEPLDRDDLVPLGIGQGRQAGAYRLPVEMDGACAAGADPAAEFGSGQADDVANGPQEGHLWVGIDRVLDAIDLDLWHGILSAR